MLEVASLGGLAVPFGLGIRAAHHCIYIVAAVTDIYDFTSKKRPLKQELISVRFLGRPCILPKVRLATRSLLRAWSPRQCGRQRVASTCAGWGLCFHSELANSTSGNQFLIYVEMGSEMSQRLFRKRRFSLDFGVEKSDHKSVPAFGWNYKDSLMLHAM